jgi:hypothetical protein
VVWVDQRDSAGEDEPDAKLYEAFVPTVTWSLRPAAVRTLRALRTTITVKPEFAGEPVKLQRVTPVKKSGATYYRPSGRGYLATATLSAGPALCGRHPARPCAGGAAGPALSRTTPHLR